MEAQRAAPVVEIASEGSYASVWLKYVTAVDLGVHCIRSLVGRRARIDPAAPLQSVRLDEHPSPAAFYLCAVSRPYVWSQNAHLAFENAPGESWSGIALVPQLRVVLHNARPITGWGGQSVPADAPHAHDRRYATCRNWQFAWYLHLERSAPLHSSH
jgi:hypothetical protein